jgi:dihydrofolate reductase
MNRLVNPYPIAAILSLVVIADFHAEGVKIVTSIDDALKVAQSIAEISDTQEAFIMGGAQIYEQTPAISTAFIYYRS